MMAKPQKCVQTEGRVTKPGVTIIPVPHSSDLFGQAKGRGRNDRACAFIGEQFQKQRGTDNGLSPAPVIIAAGDPFTPVAHSFVQ